MDYNKSYQIGHIGSIVGVLIGGVGVLLRIEFMAFAGLAVLIGSQVQEFIFYRCPNCNTSLSSRDRKPKHCPECGFKLVGKNMH